MIYIRLAALATLLFLCLSTGLSLVHGRQTNLHRYQVEVERLQAQVERLKTELAHTGEWAARLEVDPLAWEEVARERMGYLVPGEVLVTWDS